MSHYDELYRNNMSWVLSNVFVNIILLHISEKRYSIYYNFHIAILLAEKSSAGRKKIWFIWILIMLRFQTSIVSSCRTIYLGDKNYWKMMTSSSSFITYVILFPILHVVLLVTEGLAFKHNTVYIMLLKGSDVYFFCRYV